MKKIFIISFLVISKLCFSRTYLSNDKYLYSIKGDFVESFPNFGHLLGEINDSEIIKPNGDLWYLNLYDLSLQIISKNRITDYKEYFSPIYKFIPSLSEVFFDAVDSIKFNNNLFQCIYKDTLVNPLTIYNHYFDTTKSSRKKSLKQEKFMLGSSFKGIIDTSSEKITLYFSKSFKQVDTSSFIKYDLIFHNNNFSWSFIGSDSKINFDNKIIKPMSIKYNYYKSGILISDTYNSSCLCCFYYSVRIMNSTNQCIWEIINEASGGIDFYPKDFDSDGIDEIVLISFVDSANCKISIYKNMCL